MVFMNKFKQLLEKWKHFLNSYNCFYYYWSLVFLVHIYIYSWQNTSIYLYFLFVKIRHFYHFIFSQNNKYLREVASLCNECAPVTTCLCLKYIFLHSHHGWEGIGFMWKMTFEIFIKSLRFETPWVRKNIFYESVCLSVCL